MCFSYFDKKKMGKDTTHVFQTIEHSFFFFMTILREKLLLKTSSAHTQTHKSKYFCL